MLIGYDKAVINNRYFIYDLSRQQWLPELKGSYLPKGGTTKQHCAAFKTGGKTKIFLSGYAYNTNLYDVSSKKWERGEFVIPQKSGMKKFKNCNAVAKCFGLQEIPANIQGCIGRVEHCTFFFHFCAHNVAW